MPTPLTPIRLLCLDLDGTIVPDDDCIGPRTCAVVREVVARGIPVAIVTGRMVASARRFADQLGLSGPIVGYGGAVIRELPAPGSRRIGRLLYHRPVPAPVAREVYEWSQEQGLSPHLNHLELMILREDEPRADDYSRFVGGRALLVPDLQAWIRRPVTKVIASGPRPGPRTALDEARRTFGDRVSVTISHPEFLEFMAAGVTKARAVQWLARHYEVPLGATMAIGDQLNDLEMLAEVGHGVAMPSAPAEVLHAARYVAPPMEEEGAAQMIEELILGRRTTIARSSGPGSATMDDARGEDRTQTAGRRTQ